MEILRNLNDISFFVVPVTEKYEIMKFLPLGSFSFF
jgi:hypothetical protein